MYIEAVERDGPEACPEEVRAVLIASRPAPGDALPRHTQWHRDIACAAALYGLDELRFAESLRRASCSWVESRAGGLWVENGGPFDA
jgi:hypothetical protein